MPDTPIPVPQVQQQQQTSSQGVDVLNELIKRSRELSEGVTGLIKEATIPISGTGPGTSPQLVIPQGHQFQPTPLIDRPTVGAHATKSKGIANTIISAANLVGQYRDEHQKEQQRVLAVDIERIFQSQDGIRQAQETLRLDPNNVEAKQTIDKNNNIINALLSDPKKRKQIEKSLDISFTDPSQNDQMEHGALKIAADSFSGQLQAKVPQQMQPNIVAQQKLALMQAQQQSVDKMIGQITPALLREQGAAERAQMQDNTRREIAEYYGKVRTNIAEFTAKNHYQATIDAAKIHGNALLQATALRNAQSMANVNAMIASRENLLIQKLDDPIYQARIVGQSMDKITNFSKALTAQNAQLTNQKKTVAMLLANKQISEADAKKQQDGLDQLIQANTETINGYSKIQNESEAYLNNLRKGITGGTTTADGTSAIGEPEDTEPETPENDPDNY